MKTSLCRGACTCAPMVEEQVGDSQAGEFGDAGAGVVEHGQQDGVALPVPAAAVGRVEQRCDFVAGEVAERGFVEALRRDREHALGDGSAVGARSEAWRMNERMAVRRRLRVRGELPRTFSRWSRKASTSGASKSSSVSAEGVRPVRCWA